MGSLPIPGPGRPKGTVNKSTRDVRAAIAKLAEDKADEVRRWLDSVAETDPAKALDLYLKMIEYHIPKLARTEVTGRDGGPVEQSVTLAINGVKPQERYNDKKAGYISDNSYKNER